MLWWQTVWLIFGGRGDRGGGGKKKIVNNMKKGPGKI